MHIDPSVIFEELERRRDKLFNNTRKVQFQIHERNPDFLERKDKNGNIEIGKLTIDGQWIAVASESEIE